MGWREAIGAVLHTEQQPIRTRSQHAPWRSEPRLDAPAEPPERAWSGKVFDQIEWRRFEAVCEALFAQSGMRADPALCGQLVAQRRTTITPTFRLTFCGPARNSPSLALAH